MNYAIRHPMRLAGLTQHSHQAVHGGKCAGSGSVGPDTPPKHLLTPRSGNVWAGARRERRRTMVPWSCLLGVANVTLLVTARASPGWPAWISEPERAEALIRPEAQIRP
jgi:hypothetical protein